MGIDVFGRNTYGGGKMNCDVAMEAAFQEGRSPPPPPFLSPQLHLHCRVNEFVLSTSARKMPAPAIIYAVQEL